MRVAILSRFPRVDTAPWKLELVSRIVERGHELALVYTRAALQDQVAAGFREFGLGALGRYVQARRPGAETGGEQAPPSIPAWADANGVQVLRYRSIRDPEVLAGIRSLRPDLLLLAGAEIVPASILEVPTLGTINSHYGLLPKYRGMNVAEWSLFHEDPVGVSVHLVDPGIDTGDILERETIALEPGETLETIRAKQQRLSGRLLLRAVERIAAGDEERTPQRPEEGRQYYRMHPELRRAVERRLAAGGPSTS